MPESFPPFGENVISADGSPVVTWDLVNNLRIEYAPDGTSSSRDFTPEEVAQVPDLLASQAALTQHETDRSAVRAIINDVKIEMDRVQTVLDNVNSTAREKDLARASKRMGAALIDLAKFVQNMQ